MQSKETRMSRRITAINCLVLIAVLVPVVAASQATQPTQPAPSAERSRTQGLKETDRFVKSGAAISDKVGAAKTQASTTLDAYNALVTQPSKDMKGDYKRLMKARDSMNSKVADARTQLDEMQKMGDTYFSGRAESVKAIQDASLQGRAKQRLLDNQKAFADVVSGLHAAGQALEPFRKQLDDQITYLGSDLSPSGTASLKPNAEKLNKQGQEAFAKIDEAVKKADQYFQGLKATDS
jgi:predicted  nucleic acid-binding Zn-ribbon protein